MDDLHATLALTLLPKIGPVLIRRLVQTFGSAEAVLRQPESSLVTVEGIGKSIASIIASWETRVSPEDEFEKLQSHGLSIVTPSDPTFPAPLKELYDCPLLLYVWGELLEQDKNAIGVVGSRACSIYGTQTAKKLSYQLASAGITIISGLARGIDTAAHEGALAANGRTIAVIGSGLCHIYPPENMPLAEKIANGHGAVVSEFPLHQPPDRQTFPQRNRIVAGWSQGLLVVECPKRSGSLITADLANEAGKTIYAVPGQIDRPSSAGCNELIRNGAQLVTDGSDILDDLQALDFKTPVQPAKTQPQPKVTLTEREQTLYGKLSSTEITIDTLVDLTDLPASVISTTLLSLELKGLVQAFPGQLYIRK